VRADLEEIGLASYADLAVLFSKKKGNGKRW
jgi:hypothetical protein